MREECVKDDDNVFGLRKWRDGAPFTEIKDLIGWKIEDVKKYIGDFNMFSDDMFLS